MSILGIFTMPALQIWLYHVIQEANFEKMLFFPNSAFSVGKSYVISSRKALYFRSYQPKTSRGLENTPQPVLLGLNCTHYKKFSFNYYYLLTGCKGRSRKYKPEVFHTVRACEGCLENQGLVFPGTARAPS